MPGAATVSLERLGRVALHVGLVAVALFLGGRPPAATALLQLLVIGALLCWVAAMVRSGTLEWRPTAAGLPVALLLGLVAVQLAVGNRSIASWALGPPGTKAVTGEVVPTPFFLLGTIAPGATWKALGLFLTYAAVFVVVVHLFRRRRHLAALIRTLVITGVVLAVAGLTEYFAQEAGLFQWRQHERRVTASFTNADHFAAWLNLVAFLGLGQLLAGSGGRRSTPLGGLTLTEKLEELGRRYAHVVAVVVMVVAIVFTLSRGAIVSFIAGLVVTLVVAAVIGRARRTLAAVGALLAIALAFGMWLGLGPFVARFRYADVAHRWEIVLATLPMIRDFPVLGIGLGTYQEMSARYQSLALEPGRLTINHAHNDWLQLLIELGPLGLALGLYAVARVARDLVGAHLRGRSECPVGGGEQEWARRNDPFSVGLALGALGGLTTLGVHSLVDFSARVAAVGSLAATVLAIATVALHTRFGTTDGWLSARRSWELAPGQRRIAAAVGIALGAVLLVAIARPAASDLLVAMAKRGDPDLADAAGVIASSDVAVLLSRANARLDQARVLVNAGAVIPGQPAAPLADRLREAGGLLREARDLLRHAVSRNPTGPLVHERLAWTYQMLGTIEASAAREHSASALAHMQRAVALDPQNAFRYENLARLVVAAYPDLPVDVGLRAAREVVRRTPERLPEMVYQYLVMPLTDAQWVSLVPETVSGRVALGELLEQRGLTREALGVYRTAAELASAPETSVARWLFARALMRSGDAHAALRELGIAAREDPDNPEIYLSTGDALQMTRDIVAALEMYRAAVAKAETRMREAQSTDTSFRLYRPPLDGVVARQLGPPTTPPVSRYRRALALHLAERELWQQALKEADTVLADAARDPVAHFARALALEGIGKIDEALEAFRAAVSADTANVRFRLRLARALRDSRQPHQALNEWQAVLAVAPDNLEAALAVARTYDQVGAKGDAMTAYERVYRIAPDHAEARRALARFGWIER